MAVGVVDLLELVDVEEGHRQRRLAPLGTRDLLLEAVVEVAVVVDPGEGVGVRGLLEALVHVRDVDGRRDLRADGLHEREVALPERADRTVREDEHADRASAGDERHDELAAHRGVADVARVGAHVLDELRLLAREDPAGDAAPRAKARGRLDRRPRTGDGADHELVGALVAQHDREARARHVPLDDPEDAP